MNDLSDNQCVNGFMERACLSFLRKVLELWVANYTSDKKMQGDRSEFIIFVFSF